MKCDKTITNRVKRIQGQLQGVLKMMADEKSCKDVTTQLKAIKSGVEKIMNMITTNNLLQTIEEKHQLKLDNIEEAVDLVINS